MAPLHHTVLSNATPVGVEPVLHCGMADDAEIRRENFRLLMGKPFSPSEAASRLWGTPQLWSDVFHGRKAFGEKLARRIEDKLLLARMSLDDPGGVKTATLSAELMERLGSLNEEDRASAENLLRIHLKMPTIGASASRIVLSGKRQQRAA